MQKNPFVDGEGSESSRAGNNRALLEESMVSHSTKPEGRPGPGGFGPLSPRVGGSIGGRATGEGSEFEDDCKRKNCMTRRWRSCVRSQTISRSGISTPVLAYRHDFPFDKRGLGELDPRSSPSCSSERPDGSGVNVFMHCGRWRRAVLIDTGQPGHRLNLPKRFCPPWRWPPTSPSTVIPHDGGLCGSAGPHLPRGLQHSAVSLLASLRTPVSP